MIMMFDRLLSWIDRVRALREVDGLDERELGDLGLSRAGLRNVVAAPREVTDRMLAMAARHGLGPQELRGHNQDIAGMVESCRSCESLGACRAFLADPGDDPARAVFCPNHATYEALRAARD